MGDVNVKSIYSEPKISHSRFYFKDSAMPVVQEDLRNMFSQEEGDISADTSKQSNIISEKQYSNARENYKKAGKDTAEVRKIYKKRLEECYAEKEKFEKASKALKENTDYSKTKELLKEFKNARKNYISASNELKVVGEDFLKTQEALKKAAESLALFEEIFRNDEKVMCLRNFAGKEPKLPTIKVGEGENAVRVGEEVAMSKKAKLASGCKANIGAPLSNAAKFIKGNTAAKVVGGLALLGGLVWGGIALFGGKSDAEDNTVANAELPVSGTDDTSAASTDTDEAAATAPVAPESPAVDEATSPTSADDPEEAPVAGSVTTEEPSDTTSTVEPTAPVSNDEDVKPVEEEDIPDEEEIDNIDEQVEAEVRDLTYSPDKEFEVQKGDCLWNLTKEILTDALGRTPTDTEIAYGVKKMMETNDLEFTDKRNYYVLIRPEQKLKMSNFDEEVKAEKAKADEEEKKSEEAKKAEEEAKKAAGEETKKAEEEEKKDTLEVVV